MAIDATGFTKTTSGGLVWTDKVSTGIPSHMKAVAPNNDILIGGSSGGLAFSKDGGATFSVSGTPPASSGSIHLVADKAYATNGFVYATTTAPSVVRGKAQVASQTWSSKLSTTTTPVALPAGESFDGIAQVDVVSYFLSFNSANGTSTIWRTLNLTVDSPEWSSISVGTVAKPVKLAMVTPNGLNVSANITGGAKLWAIDQAVLTAEKLYSIVDNIAATAPTLSAPADAASISVNPQSGAPYSVTFTFKRQNTSVTGLQLQIAADSAFAATIYDQSFTGLTADTLGQVIGPGGSGVNNVTFLPGQTYFWRVRTSASGPWYSPYSKTQSFKVDLAIPFNIVAPANGAAGVSINPTFVWTAYGGAVGYEIALSTDQTFAVVEWSHSSTLTQYAAPEPLKYDTTYYWRVRGVTGTPAKPQTPAPGGPYITGIFTTVSAPSTATPPPAVITVPAPPSVITVPVAGPPQPIPSFLLWTIIAIGAILIIALIILIVRTRRVS
jgi:hypothetical protein